MGRLNDKNQEQLLTQNLHLLIFIFLDGVEAEWGWSKRTSSNTQWRSSPKVPTKDIVQIKDFILKN